jgi:hypothetical protein
MKSRKLAPRTDFVYFKTHDEKNLQRLAEQLFLILRSNYRRNWLIL